MLTSLGLSQLGLSLTGSRKNGGAPAGYAWLLYKDGDSNYRRLFFVNDDGQYKPLAYKAAL